MALKNRLERWVQAGLLDSSQAERIASFERDQGKPRFTQAVTLLGGLAIGIGLVSIVASNWDVIPGWLKLTLDFAMVAALGYGIARWEREGRTWAREIGILVLYGLVLASIALISQVYQLGGKAHEAMGVWSLLTVLLMTRARTGGVAFLWVAGLHVTYAVWLGWLADGPIDMEALALGAIYWAPLLTLIAARSGWVRDRRPAFAAKFEAVAWAELVLCASIATLAFYTEAISDERNHLWIALSVSALLTAFLWTRLAATAEGWMARWVLLACLALSYLPVMFSPGDLDLVGALGFIGLWLLVAFWAHRRGAVPMLNLATAVVGLRILVVYFEVFGSLLDTGVGLVLGGLLTLVLVRAWNRKRRDFGRDLGRDPT